MLSVKQSVIVQDCSHTRNNNEFKKRQRSGRKQRKTDQKVNCWHKISRETDLQFARERLKLARRCTPAFNFARNRNDFARDRIWFRARQLWFRARLKDFARKCRPVSQTASSFKAILDRLDRFLAILVSKQRIKHIEQQASDTHTRKTASKWFPSTSENNEQGKKQPCAWTIKWLSSR